MLHRRKSILCLMIGAEMLSLTYCQKMEGEMSRDPRIQAVLDAVDGTFADAAYKITRLQIDGYQLTAGEANAIMASFLMFRDNGRCVEEFGEGHEYFTRFGAKVPGCSINQLQKSGAACRFHEVFVEGRELLIDQDLYGLFCGMFNICNGEWVPTDNAAANVAIRNLLVKKVVRAVNGSFASADTAVANMKRGRVVLTSDDANSIMASFLIFDTDERCRLEYGERHGHEYFTGFGAKVPDCSVNQLRSNGLAEHFFQSFVEEQGLLVDAELYGLFCAHFHLDSSAWTSTAAALTYIVQKKDAYVVQLACAIDCRKVVIMTGIGVSLGIVNDQRLKWDGLLDAIRDMLAKRPNPVTVSDEEWCNKKEEQKAQMLDKAVKEKLAHLDYRQFVSVIMRNMTLPDQAPLADAIGSLGLPIATTNYDLVLDHCLKRFEKNLSDISARLSHHNEFVYHVHGVWFDSNSVVLSDDDYERTQYEFEYAIGKLFFDGAALNEHRSLLFIGSMWGMMDEHFNVLYTDVRFAHLEHFALLKKPDVEKLLNEKPEFLRAVVDKKLVPIVYGDRNEDLLPFLIDKLGATVREAVIAPVDTDVAAAAAAASASASVPLPAVLGPALDHVPVPPTDPATPRPAAPPTADITHS